MSTYNKIPYMETLGTRLRHRRKELRLTQKQIAKSVGVSAVSVTLWEKDETSPRGENLYSLCKALQCNPEWLLYGKSDKYNKDVPAFFSNVAESQAPPYKIPPELKLKKVPLISWVQAGNWTTIVDNFQHSDAAEWPPTTAKVSDNAFALRVKGDSMVNPLGFPSIPEGSIVIVDPDECAENGKIVVARLEDTAEATLKKLIIDGPHRYLKPLNPDYRPIQINGNCTIVGVVKQVVSDL